MAGIGTRPKLSLSSAVRWIAVLGAAAALAHLAYEVASTSFKLGSRIATRSVLTLIVPIFVASYAHVVHRGSVDRIRRVPAALRFSASLAAGALAMASPGFFLAFYPVPIAELLIGSCIAVLAFTSASLPGSRPVAPYGLAAGMLLYLAVFGVPRIA